MDTPEPLRNLADLIAAQLEYHKQSYDILSDLAASASKTDNIETEKVETESKREDTVKEGEVKEDIDKKEEAPAGVV